MKRIAFVLTGLGMGGAERQVCDLSDEYAKRGYDVLLISLTGQSKVLPKNKSIKVVEFNISKSPIDVFCALLKSRTLINNFKPNIVHSHMYHANIFSRILKLCSKIPFLINTAHSNNEGGRFRMLSYRYTDFLTNLTTNVSIDATETFITNGAVKKDKIITVVNGIDTERFQYSKEYRTEKRELLGFGDDIIFYVAVGRLCEAKDYSNMFKAFSLVIKKLDNSTMKFRLGVIGVGELSGELEILAKELGIIDYIHFLGLQNDVEKWLSAADFYLMSSAWEGLPLAIAEAMSSKCFIISTDCGGVKEMLGGDGLLVPPKNHTSFGQAMIDALNFTPEFISSCKMNARNSAVFKYSLPSIATKWLILYNDIITQKKY
ncbi:glycosyltransferase [Aliivibrio fischeri]|uniref:glycosyltransferase n=1 Tax=Aliivibrio fischeri TaxID=668 RepID=UPI001EF285A0|nr:glycosyltransferase [Aliivibrio fischeri]